MAPASYMNFVASYIIGWVFGAIVFAAGLVNLFWGNDQGFGVFLVLLSLVYFPPVSRIFKAGTGFSIPVVLKIVLGVFIVVAALGVGELPAKIELMIKSF